MKSLPKNWTAVMEDLSETRLLLQCRPPELRGKLLADLFMRYRDRLRLQVELRLDPRLLGRLDPSDVVQETFLEVQQRLDEYLKDPPMGLFLWFRRITGQKVLTTHRRHLAAQRRGAKREVSLDGGLPDATSVALASRLLADGTSPSKAASRKETRTLLQEALDSMDRLDREVIALRHFEALSNREAAATLGLEESTASKRYFSALKKLKKILGEMGIRPPSESAEE